jgi:hypothetical protein
MIELPAMSWWSGALRVPVIKELLTISHPALQTELRTPVAPGMVAPATVSSGLVSASSKKS